MKHMNFRRIFITVLMLLLVTGFRVTVAQNVPSSGDISTYDGLHKAAHQGAVDTILRLVKATADIEARDNSGRTPLIVAAFASREDSVHALAEAGADLNALEFHAYDIVTIAAVANDIEILNLALDLGANSGNVTSRYDGTALIAAAHLGHHAAVDKLIKGKAPLNHINNLGWTALIEAVVLGDGGADTVKRLNYCWMQVLTERLVTPRELRHWSMLNHVVTTRWYDSLTKTSNITGKCP